MEAIAIRPSVSSSCRRNPIHVQPRRSLFPTCCHVDLSSSFKDDEGSAFKAEWKSIRARPVAAENASRFIDPSSSTFDLISPQIKLGDKWAHKIYEPEKGCLLLATEKLDGHETFERAVILLIQVGPNGPSGIILNHRPQEKQRSTLMGIDRNLLSGPMFFGGPVREGVFLMKTNEALAEKEGVLVEVMQGLYCGLAKNLGLVSDIVKREKAEVDDFRLFQGYCGWKNKELEEGIVTGFWTPVACSASVIESCCGYGFGVWREIHDFICHKKIG